MKRRTAYWLVGGAVVGTAVVSVFRAKPFYERVSGPPISKALVYIKPDASGQFVQVGPAMPLVKGQRVPRILNPADSVELHRELARELGYLWTMRRKQLPADANPHETDKYSKELYFVPSWLLNVAPEKLTANDVRSAASGAPVDEFGRRKPGHYGESDQSLWGQTLGGLLKNPLAQKTLLAAALASGPSGWAMYSAYRMWDARGTEITLKNAALVAGKAAAESQCGPACGVAFEFGVGAASGKSVNKSGEQALIESMSPEQRAAFEAGKQQVHKLGL